MIDLISFAPVSTSNSRTVGTPSISIINTLANEKRIKLSKAVLKKLGNPDKVQITYGQDYLAISSHLPNAGVSSYKVSKGVIYNTPLINKITQYFQLNYTTGRTIYSFGVIETQTLDDGDVALIFKLS